MHTPFVSRWLTGRCREIVLAVEKRLGGPEGDLFS